MSFDRWFVKRLYYVWDRYIKVILDVRVRYRNIDKVVIIMEKIRLLIIMLSSR